ncbi:MAG: cell envelope integrity protein TolA [Arhodomonas sp.]|nr:cell envelope integrity protein TolA [Arhodomonas sp.]
MWNSQINRNWIRPATVPDGLSCVIRIRVAPNGMIRGEPEIVESSGNAAFDRSAVRAVQKTGELRMPEDQEVARRLSPINLRFRPGGS